MAGSTLLKSILMVALLSPFCVQPRPMGGKFKDNIYSFNASEEYRINGSCHMIGMHKGGKIYIDGNLAKTSKEDIKLRIVAKLFKLQCANLMEMDVPEGVKPCERNPDLINVYAYDNRITLEWEGVINKTLTEKSEPFKFDITTTVPQVAPPTFPPTSATDAAGSVQTANTTTVAAAVSTSNPVTKPQRRRRAEPSAPTEEPASNKETAAATKEPATAVKPGVTTAAKGATQSMGEGAKGVFATNISKNGVYLLQVYIERLGGQSDKNSLSANVTVVMHNPYGYLSAIDYPALVFYGIMTSVYTIYAIAWIIMMLCSFNDLVRLQFWVLAVIILGFLEKTFFVAEYSAINLGNDTYGSYVVAEFVSAVKRGLSRMLLIIVAMGFGTVKPRLGDSLFKVVAAGVAYFVLALIDGIMRSRANTFHTRDTSSMVTLILLLLLDTFIFYWIFTAIVDTRRTLRLRKNYTKLAMYNHFAYTLIFAIIATVAFIIWVFVALEYPADLCLTDWGEAWLRDCFWHVLFAFILLVVMIIWRPSSNRSRFAYSLVTDADDDEVLFEQGNNKNFDTLKMRSVNKPGDPPPPVTSQAEDELRWVEENLPSTAMDKALPLLLDSDEEVMTTKFEVSKMN